MPGDRIITTSVRIEPWAGGHHASFGFCGAGHLLVEFLQQTRPSAAGLANAVTGQVRQMYVHQHAKHLRIDQQHHNSCHRFRNHSVHFPASENSCHALP